jgi:WD40 repeat protein
MPETPLVEVLVLQRHAWKRGERPTLEQLLDAHPHLRDSADAVLDMVYNEVMLREEGGEKPTLADYVGRFPHLAAELRAQFEVDGALTDLPPQGPSTVPATGPATDPDALPRLEGCDLLDELGRGAMGTVYRGWQRAAKRPVAVKLLAGDVPAGRVRNEVQAASRLHHPHIVAVYEVKEHEGRPALVLEYVEGGNLAQKLGGKPVAPADAAHLVEQLARAMAYAHGRGVVHRDLKPSNVLLSGGPDAPLSRCEPKIGDFGLAKMTEDSPHLTRTSDILGTPSYMAPEQTGGEAKSVGPLADVYALGAVLYECLTGRPPFVGQGMLDTLEQVRRQEPVPPSRLNPAVPGDLDVICLKCLHKTPGRRYASADQLADDLHRFQTGEPIRARRVGLPERAWKWAKKRPMAAALGGVTAVVSAALIVGAVVVGQVLRRERDLAVRQAAELEDRLRQTRGLLYTAQLLRVAALRDADPAQALAMLDDPARCPEDLRCFSWAVLRGLCKPYREAHSHPGPPAVRFAASADGKAFATLAAGGEVTWEGGGTTVLGAKAIAISPEGRWLAVGDVAGRVRVIDLTSSAEPVTITTRGAVGGLALSSGGRTLTVNGAGGVGLYDLRTGKARRTFKEPTDPQSPPALSADGTMLACTLRNETIQLWDTRTGRPLTVMKGMAAPVRSLAFHPDGRTVAAGAADGVVRLWETEGGSEVDSLAAGIGAVVGLAFHPSRRVIALAGAGHDEDERAADIDLWDLTLRRGLGPLRGHGGAVGVAFTDAGATLRTVGENREEKQWDFPGDLTRLPLGGHADGPIALGASHIAWVARVERPGGVTDEVMLFDRARAAQRRMPTRGRRVLALAIPADGGFVVTGSGTPGEPGEALVWDPVRGWPIQVLPGHAAAVVAVACSADGARVAIGCADGTVRLWALDGSKELWVRSLGSAPAALAIDGATVAAVGGTAFAAWHADGTEIKRVEVSARARCLALRGRVAVSGGGGGVVTLIDLDGAAEPVPTPFGAVTALALSPDGRTLAVGGAGSAVRLWDVATGQERLALPGHRGGACFVGFAPAGDVLLSASRAGEMRLWYARPR